VNQQAMVVVLSAQRRLRPRRIASEPTRGATLLAASGSGSLEAAGDALSEGGST